MEKAKLQNEAKELLNNFLEQKKVSKVKLAKKLGISHAVLTYVSQEQWENVSDEMLLKIINTLKPDNFQFQIIETINFNTVQTLCTQVQRGHFMCGLIGYSGAGKTTALQHFYNINPNVYYVQSKKAMNRKQFFAAILKELGISYFGNLYDMLNKIVEAVNSKYSPLLIIDEAGKLSKESILDLHDLRNDTMNNLGIVLAGCEYFKENLETAADKDKVGMPEFYSRVMNWQTLSSPSKIEIETIFKLNGIDDNDLLSQSYKNFREIASEIFSAHIKRELSLNEIVEA